MWHRTGAHRAIATQGDGGRPRRLRAWRRQRRSRVAPMPRLVIREPEESWWATQDEWDEAAATPLGATTTVAAFSDRDADTDGVVARLAELAVADELLIVFGSAFGARPGQQAVLAGLRSRLPRHHVVAVHVQHRGADMRKHAAVLERFLEVGSLPVVVTASAAMHDVTAEISSYVQADRVLRVFSSTTGPDLYSVWRRQPEPCVN
jgi:hypothetical protein